MNPFESLKYCINSLNLFNKNIFKHVLIKSVLFFTDKKDILVTLTSKSLVIEIHITNLFNHLKMI